MGVFFFLKALASKTIDSSIVFGINNVSIVILSVLIGIIIFKEKVNKINIAGIASAISAIIFLSIS
jgi:multidrug transporter EmrE-like cation transporter